jgi:hypothetical protein
MKSIGLGYIKPMISLPSTEQGSRGDSLLITFEI